MADIYNLDVAQGSSIYFRIVAKDDNSQPLDLTNYNVSGYVRHRYTDTGIVLNLSPTIDGSFISGFIDVDVAGASTALLPVMQGVYDIEISNKYTSYQTKVVKGLFNVEPEVTH